ncbi:uncharacterized protein LOC110035957 [Phalaenopsis equestris]|uniref:uncharacterized protein LOC110035957 n=1 Tax=Phalaenopsis equestris TaxID=78828 RepID=UPI0009E3F555|nr:uncharacterized protein LOC110035957 [Phalaenopsis equestris]
MKIVKWTLDFDPSKGPPVVPIWYTFPGLPLPFFKLNALFNIRRALGTELWEALGTPLKVDAPTYNKARPALNIVSEQKPYYCQHCRMFGHTVEKCSRLHRPIKRNAGKDHKETRNTLLQAIENFAEESHLHNRKDHTQRIEEIPSIIKVHSSSEDPLDKPSEGSPTKCNTVTSPINIDRKEIQEITIITPSPSPHEEGKTDMHDKTPEDHVIPGIKQAIEDDWQVQTARRKRKQVNEVQKLQHGRSKQVESKASIKIGSPHHHKGCTKEDRKELWSCLLNISQLMDSLWIVGGDFNCIASPAKKIGGRAPNLTKMNTFTNNIHRAGLFDLGFKGPAFTWKRGLVGSNHRPILISITSSDNMPSPSPFRYLNMWSSHPSYNSYIANLWNGISHTDPLINLRLLHIKNAKVLRSLIWGTFGNVLTNVQELEEEVLRLEQLEQEGLVEEKELLTAQNKLLTPIDYQDQYLKQKAAMNIFKEGDRNTKFYHAYIKYNRKCNTIHAIETVEGNWLHENAEIANDAVSYFKNLLNQENNPRSPIDPDYFNAEKYYTANLKLADILDEEEIWKAIISIDSSKAAGLDGFTAEFYKKSWDIIKPEVIAFVASFFQGNNLPQYFSASTFVLIPKSELQTTWNHFRPICLSTVISKVISKITINRLQPHLEHIIKPNQTVFLKGRSIIDNTLLAQKLLNDLNKTCRGGNLIYKLDLKKAYDTISWGSIMYVLTARGFKSDFCQLILRRIHNNNHYILINGKGWGSFTASRGLKQGDPLSPTIFIIAIDYLSRILDNSLLSQNYTIYHHRSNFAVTHLIYADDVMVFSRAHKNALRKVYQTLQKFQTHSGMCFSPEKCLLIFNKHANPNCKQWASSYTGFSNSQLPVKFLWKPPGYYTVKVNTDESFNKLGAGFGGVYRNHLGKCLLYFHIPIVATDAVETELVAVYWALKIAKMSSWYNLWLKVDSTAVIKILKDEELSPWHLAFWTKKMREISSQLKVQYTFIYIEGNQPANWLV